MPLTSCHPAGLAPWQPFHLRPLPQGQGLDAAAPGVPSRVNRHQLGGRLAGAQQPGGHGVHGLGDTVLSPNPTVR